MRTNPQIYHLQEDEPSLHGSGPFPVHSLLHRWSVSTRHVPISWQCQWSAQFYHLHKWQQTCCCQYFACNPTQNAQWRHQHERLTYQHHLWPHLNSIQATLQARKDDESQRSLLTILWLVCNQVRMHFGRRLQDQLDGNGSQLAPVGRVDINGKDWSTGTLAKGLGYWYAKDWSTGMLAKGLRYWYANCLQSRNVWICLMYEFTCMNSFEQILGRNIHFRKESHSPEAIAFRRNVFLRKRFQSNQTSLKIAHFYKIITNRKWILHLHLYDRGHDNASNLRWSDSVFTSDWTKMTGTVLASLPTLFYWSCKIALIVSFWFRIFLFFLSFGL